MTSLRALAACIGVPSSFSVIRDFYGYKTGLPETLSLLTQVRLLKGKHLHVNLIRVGVENFTWADEQKLDWAVCKLREIYAQENARLGVGRVDRCDIAEAQAQTLGIFNSVIVDNGQMGGLTDAFDGPPGALDAFFVLNIATSKLGRSDIDGDCDKSYDVLFMTGSVVSMEGSGDLTARVLAHELGHYLGLWHPGWPFRTEDFPFSLMAQLKNISDKNKPLDSVYLSEEEGADIRDHCFVRFGCSG